VVIATMEIVMYLTTVQNGIVMQHTYDENIWNETLMWMEHYCQLFKVQNNIFSVVDGEMYQKYLW
jgi:hypothetical protein